MRVCLIFFVLVATGAYALDVKTTVPQLPLKDAKALQPAPLADATTTTAKPNVDSAASNTTTLAPNTITTPASNTTTTALPTTSTPTPAPIPVPDPEIGKWVANGTDAIIVLRMAAQLDVTYNVTSQQSLKKEINIPADNNVTTATGKFEKNTESIKLSWKASNASSENVVVFNFNKNEKSQTYTLSSVEVSIDASELPGLNATLELKHSKEHFNTTIGHSYRCVKLQNFNLTKADNPAQVGSQLKVTDFQFQAFKNDNKINFGLAEDCAFDTSDVVPIAVGCVLAGLVVIVLVAYLISRRRSQARGYYSM